MIDWPDTLGAGWPAAQRDVPILVLTCHEGDRDVLSGFGAGADDCLAKPFSPRVLVARVRAILRRAGSTWHQADDRFVAGDICLDGRGRSVTVAGREVGLTASEFDLLRVLMEHPGWVYTREQLVERPSGAWATRSRCRHVRVRGSRNESPPDLEEQSGQEAQSAASVYCSLTQPSGYPDKSQG